MNDLRHSLEEAAAALLESVKGNDTDIVDRVKTFETVAKFYEMISRLPKVESSEKSPEIAPFDKLRLKLVGGTRRGRGAQAAPVEAEARPEHGEHGPIDNIEGLPAPASEPDELDEFGAFAAQDA